MPAANVTRPADLDPRVSGFAPVHDGPPSPPLPLTYGESEADALANMRLVLRAYIQRFGAGRVLDTISQITAAPKPSGGAEAVRGERAAALMVMFDADDSRVFDRFFLEMYAEDKGIVGAITDLRCFAHITALLETEGL